MNNYYGNPLSGEELRRQLAGSRRDGSGPGNRVDLIDTSTARTSQQHDAPLSAMAGIGLSANETLADIMRQNANEIHRRRSAPQFPGPMSLGDGDRRMSVMDFGGHGNAADAFDFNFNDGMGGAYGNMGGSMALGGDSNAFGQHMMGMSDSSDFSNLSSEMLGNMMAFSNLNVGQMQADANAMGMFSPSGMGNQYGNGNMDTGHDDFDMDMNVDDDLLSTSSTSPSTARAIKTADDDLMAVGRAFAGGTSAAPQQQSQNKMNMGQDLSAFSPGFSSNMPPDVSNTPSYRSPVMAQQGVGGGGGGGQPSGTAASPTTATAVTSAPTPGGTGRPEKDKSVYSKSGFDMLRALWYVATRKSPQVSLGAVDMSCAFVVCDVSLNDCPIIYVSDNFQNLTGYNRHEIVGQNCRFLQAPDGKVEAGTKREFVADEAVYNLKRKVAEGKEVQQSLINYRKGGKPFLNLLTMVPIPWDTQEIRYFIGFQIDLVECPDAISKNESGGSMQVNYVHSDIGQYIWTPPTASQWEPESGQTLGIDDVSTLLQQFSPTGMVSDWHRQSWDKMLLENTDDVVHVLSLKGLFLYLSPACKKVLEYDTTDLMGNSLSSICHPSDIVPVTRELKDTVSGSPVNIVFRIRRKKSGYTWFESHGSLFAEVGKGRKCIILVGRKRPVFALQRRDLESCGGIGDSEFWTKMSTSGMFLFVSSNVRSLLDLMPDNLQGISMHDLMRKESRPDFGRAIEKARRGKIVTCKHEVQNKRGQVLQAQTTMYPGDASEGEKPTFLLAQTKLIKASSRSGAHSASKANSAASPRGLSCEEPTSPATQGTGLVSLAGGGHLHLGSQEAALAADDNIFDELKTTRCTSWQYELRQMEKVNRLLAEELAQLLSNKKRRKRRKGSGNVSRDCANCHTRNTPEWRRGPSGNRDLCNSCGLRWAKQTGRVSPRNSSRGGNGDSQSKNSGSPIHISAMQRDVVTKDIVSPQDNSAEPGKALANSATTGNAAATPSHIDGAFAGVGASGLSANDILHGFYNPPQSQPMLEGGSGFGGGGMEMTAIREEREGA